VIFITRLILQAARGGISNEDTTQSQEPDLQRFSPKIGHFSNFWRKLFGQSTRFDKINLTLSVGYAEFDS